ncbi:DUF501 domain-containing protein [Sanguibacter hominis ATCC BAA-789]|uniref:DUF501 domain-containing protein n=1 Tax=Sanguibacter hominis ATCC BAA-789 TaxID=1312740 RepID=A0A9X5FEA3_9MICO|nr:DUF501 domain-containing protein [Sanguibacter hominis ATCC BAA-789]
MPHPSPDRRSPVNDQPAASPAADDPTALLGHDETATEGDLAVVAEQLGRPARGVVGIAARCRCGRPLVVRTAPRLDDGTPFPTTYYLTHPVLVAAASTLEANGVMKEMSERLVQDEELAAAYRRAHEHYLAQREALGHVDEIDGISAGGMPTRVKCLHVLIGHALAAGPGVQPLGDEALEMIRDTWNRDRCFC